MGEPRRDLMLVSRSLPFYLEVAAGVKKGKASLPLKAPISLSEILVIFPINTGNRLIYRFFEDATGKVPSTGDVGGLDLFRDVTDRGELVGENVAYSVPHHAGWKEGPIYIKFQVENLTATTMIAAAVLHLVQER